MNKKISFKFLIITLAATLTISFILPFNHIYAEYDYPVPTTITQFGYNKNNNDPIYFQASASGIYYSAMYTSDNWGYMLFYSSSYNNKYVSLSGAASSSKFLTNTYTYNNSTYNYALYKNDWLMFDSDIHIDGVNVNSNDLSDVFCHAVGSCKLPDTPPVQPGDLTFNYYTDFASNSQTTINAMKSNRDTITWDYDFTDSNISALDLKVDIRAIPVNYYSATEQDLKTLSWNNLNMNVSLYADLGSYHINYNMRKVSYTWEEVVDKISYISNLPDIYNNLVNDWNFKIFNLNNYYYWTGWVYQIRLNTDSGDYTGEWQTIYQVSSAPPEDASTTINYYVYGNGMTEPVYQTIQNINNQNNITNNTWYVNGSPYDVDPSTGQSWWEQLIQFITNIVSEILGFLGSIFDSVITGVLEFIHDLGIDFLGLFENLISNIVDLFGNIDLTGSNFTIPEEYTDDLNTYNTWTTGVFNIFFSSGLALFVLIPLLLMIVRLVL